MDKSCGRQTDEDVGRGEGKVVDEGVPVRHGIFYPWGFGPVKGAAPPLGERYMMDSFAILFLLGLIVGPVSSFFGVGGGFIVVPGLYWPYPDLPPQVVISTSFGVIFLNGLVNIRNFLRASLRPRWKLAISIALIMAMGALVGSTLSFRLSVYALKNFLACVLVFNAVMTLFAKTSQEEAPVISLRKRALIPAFSLIFLAGVMAGITGLGGGIILLPVFYHLLKIPFRKLSLYSNIAMLGSCFVGVVNYIVLGLNGRVVPWGNSVLDGFQWGYFNGALALCIFVGAFVSSPLGVWAKKRVRGRQDKYLFSALLLFLSGRLFWSLWVENS